MRRAKNKSIPRRQMISVRSLGLAASEMRQSGIEQTCKRLAHMSRNLNTCVAARGQAKRLRKARQARAATGDVYL